MASYNLLQNSDPEIPDGAWDYRAVKDCYKGLSNEAIKGDLDSKRTGFTAVMSHIEGDFNFGNVVRSANSFGANCVYYIGGKRRWDRRSAIGSYHYIDVNYIPTWDDFYEVVSKDPSPNLVGIENNIDYPTLPISDYVWGESPYVVFGEEGKGIPPEGLELIEELDGSFVTIPSVGSVRSLNVASAASIVFYDIHNKMGTIFHD